MRTTYPDAHNLSGCAQPIQMRTPYPVAHDREQLWTFEHRSAASPGHPTTPGHLRAPLRIPTNSAR